MKATIRINTDMLGPDFLNGIKEMFPHKTVEITIQSADATDDILSNPPYARELQERIAEYDKKQETITLKANELL